MNQILIRSRLRGLLLPLGALALLQTSGFAAFTILNVGTLPAGSNLSTAIANLPDGRLIYGTKNSLFEQTALGGSATSSFANALPWDPSSVAIFDSTHGVVGKGTFSNSNLYLFDPSNLNTSFTPVPGVSIENFGLLFRDASTLLVGGTNGTGGAPSISVVKTDGTRNKVIIDNAGPYSGAFAMDLAGNLYVSASPSGNLYSFTPTQIDAAIAGTALNLTDGRYRMTLKRTGSLAVDALGRIVAGGYGSDNGFDVYDLNNGRVDTFTPAGDNTNYIVTTYHDPAGNRIGFVNVGYSTGEPVTYGYDLASNVPEPASGLCLLSGVLTLAHRRRRHAALA